MLATVATNNAAQRHGRCRAWKRDGKEVMRITRPLWSPPTTAVFQSTCVPTENGAMQASTIWRSIDVSAGRSGSGSGGFFDQENTTERI